MGIESSQRLNSMQCGVNKARALSNHVQEGRRGWITVIGRHEVISRLPSRYMYFACESPHAETGDDPVGR